MSQQQKKNEAIAHRFHMNIFQEGKLEMADDIASDFVWRNPIIPSELQHGPESVKKIASAVIDAMPDRQINHFPCWMKPNILLENHCYFEPNPSSLSRPRLYTLVSEASFEVQYGKIYSKRLYLIILIMKIMRFLFYFLGSKFYFTVCEAKLKKRLLIFVINEKFVFYSIKKD